MTDFDLNNLHISNFDFPGGYFDDVSTIGS